MSSTVTMKITKNGQISLPAEVRRRWNTDRVIVIDTPYGLVIRPFDPHAVERLRGKYKGRLNGVSSDEDRRLARLEPTRASRLEDAHYGRAEAAE
jgi:AbrB family looped-hinge helix DNA binding protein